MELSLAGHYCSSGFATLGRMCWGSAATLRVTDHVGYLTRSLSMYEFTTGHQILPSLKCVVDNLFNATMLLRLGNPSNNTWIGLRSLMSLEEALHSASLLFPSPGGACGYYQPFCCSPAGMSRQALITATFMGLGYCSCNQSLLERVQEWQENIGGLQDRGIGGE